MSQFAGRFSQDSQLLGLCTECRVSLDFQLVCNSCDAHALGLCCLGLLFNHAWRGRKMGESEGELVRISRRVVGARIGLWMNPLNGAVCVYVCVCERDMFILVGSRGVWNC